MRSSLIGHNIHASLTNSFAVGHVRNKSVLFQRYDVWTSKVYIDQHFIDPCLRLGIMGRIRQAGYSKSVQWHS